MQQQDSFQAAIDYLIANRKKPVFTNRGLFTEPAQPDQPAPATKPSVMSGLFGDEYIRKPQDRDSGNYEQPFTGNPFSGKSPFGPTTANDVARWSALEGGLRANPNAVGGIASLLTGNPVVGVLARYGAPALANYFGERSYDNFIADQDARAANVAAAAGLGGIGTYSDANGNIGTISNQAMIDAYDRATFGITGAEMNAQRGNDVTVGGPIDTSLVQGTSLDFGGTDYSSSVGADAPGTDYSGYSAADLGL
jgi:hypothetical protein